jgi:hypothetical protein
MSYAYHGNYCGPGWSAGQYQTSQVSEVQAIDEFDETCKQHDASYALKEDLRSADLHFAWENLYSLNPKRMVAGALVGIQGLIRGPHDKLPTSIKINNLHNYCEYTPEMVNVKKNNLRGTLAPLTKKEKKNLARVIADTHATDKFAIKPNLKQKSRYLEPTIRQQLAPVSIGTSIKATKPVTRAVQDGLIVSGREFLVSVYESSNTNWQLSACAPLHPMFYPASVMGSLARTYQKYRFNRVTVHFITRQPTSVTGEVALVYSSQVTEPAENGASANFLPRVMTRGNAILGPIWQCHSIEIDCDSTFRLIDPFISPDITEHIFGEVQAYTLSSVTDTAGYLLIDYDIQFKTTMFTPHSTILPLTTGPGAQYALTDVTTTPTALSAVTLTNTTVLTPVNGTVWKMIINADESTPATGTTLANAWITANQFALTTTTTGSGVLNYTIADGNVIYVVDQGNNLYCYISLESAIAGDGSGQLYYRTTGSTAASWQVNGYVVRMGLTQIGVNS